MSADLLRVVGSTGLFFLFIFLLGYWLSNSGKPYNVIILTIHKLISVAAVVFLVVTIYQMNRVAKLNGVELTVSVITGLLFLSAIISGGLLSTNKPMPVAIVRMHQITPFLTVFCTAITLYLLLAASS
jgi:heme A synthase